MRWARLQKAAARADGGEPGDWAELARDLGYADQAHVTRDFTATVECRRALRCCAVRRPLSVQGLTKSPT